MASYELYTVAQAAEICQVDEATIRLAIRQDELRGWKIALDDENRLWVLKADLPAWAVSRATSKGRL